MPSFRSKRKQKASTLTVRHSVKVVLLGDSGVGKTSVALRFVQDEFHPFQEATIGASYLSKVVTLNGINSPDNKTTTVQEIELKLWDTAGQERYQSLTPLYFRQAGAAIVMYDVLHRHSFQTLQRWIRELRNYVDPVANEGRLQLNKDTQTASRKPSVRHERADSQISSYKDVLEMAPHDEHDHEEAATSSTSSSTVRTLHNDVESRSVDDCTEEESRDIDTARVDTSAQLRQTPPPIVLAICGNKSDLHEHRTISTREAQEYASSVGAFYMETSARDNVNVSELFTELARQYAYRHGHDNDAVRQDGIVDLSAPMEKKGLCC